jgi:hypothetical protein
MYSSRIDLDIMNACAVHLSNRVEEGPRTVDSCEAESVTREQKTSVGFVVDSTACLEKCYANHWRYIVLGRTTANDGVDDRRISHEAISINDVFDLGW